MLAAGHLPTAQEAALGSLATLEASLNGAGCCLLEINPISHPGNACTSLFGILPCYLLKSRVSRAWLFRGGSGQVSTCSALLLAMERGDPAPGHGAHLNR